MPFTLTHTAAILPIARFAPKLPLSALAIGSMLPDAPIFLTLGYGYTFLHSLPGLLLASIPLGLAFYYAYHRFLKPALINLLPDFAACRLQTYLKHPSPSFVTVAIALFLGAATHVVWDLFTHAGKAGVALIPLLQNSYHMSGYSIAGHEIAQHGSSAIFLPILACVAIRRLARLPPAPFHPPASSLRRLTQLAILSVPGLSAFAVWSAGTSSIMTFLFETTVLCGMLLLLAVGAYGLALSWQAQPVRQR